MVKTYDSIGKAQTDIFKFDGSLKHLFPSDAMALPNLKDLDEASESRFDFIFIIITLWCSPASRF